MEYKSNEKFDEYSYNTKTHKKNNKIKSTDFPKIKNIVVFVLF